MALIKNRRNIRLKKYRPEAPEQDARSRILNFNEVSLSYDLETALKEADRCLQCAEAKCVEGCRLNANIPEFIRLLRENKILEAFQIIKRNNPLPAITCRTCLKERQCEGSCLLGKRFEPIAIGQLERFITDHVRKMGLYHVMEDVKPNGKSIAIIGSGPSGITTAGELVKLGYEITIYESLYEAGGILAYGIPEYRLPKDIVKSEIDFLLSHGVKIDYNTHIGKDITLENLKNMGYSAIFIGIGTCKPMTLKIDGMELEGVIDAQEYLKKVNLVKAYGHSEREYPINRCNKVIIIGAGNVAMDAARTAIRLGSETVTVVYRRSIEQAPAGKAELKHAQEEGIIFQFLTNPVRFIGDKDGNIKEMEVIRMKLGDPDSSGRERPIPIENSEFLINADLIIVSIGNEADVHLTNSCEELKIGKGGNISIDDNGKTNIKGIYAGGDIVSGAYAVSAAILAAKRAARDIHASLSKADEEFNDNVINYYYLNNYLS